MKLKSLDQRILELCAEANENGKATSMSSLASKLPNSTKEVRGRIEALRTGGFLTGGRALRISSDGTDALLALLEEPEDDRPTTIIAHPVTAVERRVKLSDSLAAEYMVEPDALFRVISKNVISVKRGEEPPTNEEVMLVMSICNAYNLNPFLKHIHAFRSKGRLVTPVGYDGWIFLANSNARFKGVQYEYPKPEDMVERFGKMCFPWVKATCFVDGKFPTEVVAFLDEWANTDNWTDHPNHRLRLKAYTMSVREGLGIALPDEIDAEIIRANDLKLADRGVIQTQGTAQDLLTELIKRDGPALADQPVFDEDHAWQPPRIELPPGRTGLQPPEESPPAGPEPGVDSPPLDDVPPEEDHEIRKDV